METTTKPGADGDSADKPTSEAVGEIAGEAVAKTAVPEKSKRGRPTNASRGLPPTGRTYNPAGKPPAKTVYEVDVALVQKVVASGLKSVDGILCRNLGATARIAGFNAEQTEAVVESARMTPEENVTLSELAGVLAEKYGVLGQYAVEFMFVVVAGGYMARTYLSFRQLKILIAQQTELRRRANAPVVMKEPDKP